MTKDRGTRLREAIYLIIILCGLVMLYYLTPMASLSRESLLLMGVFILVSIALMFKPVSIDTNFTYSLEDVCAYGAIFLKGAGVAVWVMFLSSLIFESWKLILALMQKKGKISMGAVLANFSNPFLRVIITGGAGLAYMAGLEMLSRFDAGRGSLWVKGGAYLTCILVFFLLSSFFGTLLMATRQGFTIDILKSTWQGTWKMISPHLLMLAPLGVLLALLYQTLPYAALLLLVPVYIMHVAISTIREVLKQALNTIEFMSVTLDQRDAYTYGHSERVSRYSATVAGRMALSPDQVEEIRQAGLIHDLGKIAIPDRVLRKSAALDDQEYSMMKAHTHTIALLFKSLKVIPRMIPLQTAMYHHERYDGAGYIYGLKGQEIPLGSRILSVCDTYDAMTSDRPYRKGLSEEEAARRLKDAAGTQLDPDVVEVFLKLQTEGKMKEIREEIQGEPS